MNKVTIIGRLTRDPEVRYTKDGVAVARFTLAVDRRKTAASGEAAADFIPCIAFKKTGEFVEKYVNKGMKIAVFGHLQSGSFTNKDGQKVYTLDLIAEEIEFAESKQSQEKTPAVPESAASQTSEEVSEEGGFVPMDGDFSSAFN